MSILNAIRALFALALVLLTAHAHAAVTCTVSSPGVATNYNTTVLSTTIVQSNLTVTCTANAIGDLGSFSYSVGADNGLNPTAGKPRAQNGASYVTYDTYVSSSCAGLWKNTPAASARLPSPAPGTLTLSSVGVPVSAITNYWVCIPAAQSGVGGGTHTDTITMTVYSGTSNSSLATGSLPVSITVNPTCTISTPPGTVALTYTSFGAAASANTTFATTCTSGTLYTLSLSSYSGTLLGLNYTLGLSATGGTGNGNPQSYIVTGNIAAGQGGTCPTTTCNASASHTLTITY